MSANTSNSFSLSRHWLLLFNLVVGLYVALPILAPMLMEAGLTTPARIIYTAYSPMCHQMAFRSFFLGGEQPVYPRALAGASRVKPFEAYAASLSEFQNIPSEDWPDYFLAARRFLGNAQMGYKMALCERDISIFGALLVGGLIYAVARRRLVVRPLPIVWFVLIGMVPIGLDGFSQLLGYYGLSIPQLAHIFPLRESAPWLRSLTGAWFGLCVAWLALPNIDLSVRGPAQVEIRPNPNPPAPPHPSNAA